MNREWAHLSPAAVIAIHREVIAASGGSQGIRDAALLESAVGATQATAFGEPVFKDGIEIASAYLFYLCRNHPFIDGNKRVALASSLVFLERNGLLYHENPNVDEWEKLVLDVAASRLDRAETTKRLRSLIES